jgi:thiol-disulfide isomerase/thioredoxin
MLRLSPRTIVSVLALTAALLPNWSWAATPTLEQALSLVPVQPGVDYDRPAGAESAKCRFVVRKYNGHVGWIVEGPDGAILRRFVDTNDDNTVDQWCYYKDGVEVYRDIDSNFDGKADQYRWFNTGGSRWGIDANQDGIVDYWKSISAEEVTAEAIAALATRDADRFARLVLAPAELKSLGLGRSRTESLVGKTAKAVAGFKAMAARQTAVASDAAWLQFSAGRPGIVPAGTDGSTKDVRVYENAVAIIQNGGKHGQVQIGTLVQAGDAWRLIDLPPVGGEGQADAGSPGFFFQASITHRSDMPSQPSGGETAHKLLADLENLDRDAAKATTPEEQAKVVARRADLLQQIADAARTPDERGMWLRQVADTISAAVQFGTCPDGAERLKSLFEKLQKSGADKELAAYVRFRQLTAGYALSMQAKKADYSKIQAEWMKTLEQYVGEYPTSPDAAEAMLQLAINQEFAGQEEEAKKWYTRVVNEFPQAPASKKAAGAVTRLDSVGKTLTLAGKSPLGSPVDLEKFRGKVVLIQYWASSSPTAKADMTALKGLWNKYGNSFTIVGVNLDNNAKELNAYLSDNPLPWPQIYEEGGLDSGPANRLGILTVPTMFLIDQQGKVVSRNIAIGDVEAEVKKLIR